VWGSHSCAVEVWGPRCCATSKPLKLARKRSLDLQTTSKIKQHPRPAQTKLSCCCALASAPERQRKTHGTTLMQSTTTMKQAIHRAACTLWELGADYLAVRTECWDKTKRSCASCLAWVSVSVHTHTEKICIRDNICFHCMHVLCILNCHNSVLSCIIFSEYFTNNHIRVMSFPRL